MRAKAKRKPVKRTRSKIITPSRMREYTEEVTAQYDASFAQDTAAIAGAAETLTTRQSTHGDFSENARVMQGVKRVLRTGINWMCFLRDLPHSGTLSDVQAEAIEMIVVKLGRIVTGDPNHADNWLDIEGYARLARERLT